MAGLQGKNVEWGTRMLDMSLRSRVCQHCVVEGVCVPHRDVHMAKVMVTILHLMNFLSINHSSEWCRRKG